MSCIFPAMSCFIRSLAVSPGIAGEPIRSRSRRHPVVIGLSAGLQKSGTRKTVSVHAGNCRFIPCPLKSVLDSRLRRNGGYREHAGSLDNSHSLTRGTSRLAGFPGYRYQESALFYLEGDRLFLGDDFPVIGRILDGELDQVAAPRQSLLNALPYHPVVIGPDILEVEVALSVW